MVHRFLSTIFVKYLVFLYFIGISCLIEAQTASKFFVPVGDDRNQDAYEAIPICSDTYYETFTSSGRGALQELKRTCLFLGERRSRWYVFTVQRNGSLAFSIDTRFNLDWALYDVTTSGSYAIRESAPVRCNYSENSGPTGMKGNSTGNSQGLFGSPWSNEMNVTAGQTFLLIIDNPLEINLGYTIHFTGTTTLTDNANPIMKSVQYNCTEEALTVRFSEPIRCATIQAADFSITGSKAVTVTAAEGINCMAPSDLTRSVKVSFNGNMTTGAYTLHLKAGAIEDNCGLNNMVGMLNFDYLGKVGITAVNDTLCENDNTLKTTLTATGGGSYVWTPNIGLSTNTGSKVEAKPTQTTTYWATVKYGTCERKVSKVVTINSAPVVTISPKNSILCTGTSVNLQGNITLDGLDCTDCSYTWSNGSTSNQISAGVGSYTLTATTSQKCKSMSTATVQSASVPSPNSCNIIYVSPTGRGTGLKANDPTNIQNAVSMASCNNVTLFLQNGTYNLSEKLYLGSYITLEGGFNADYTQKSSQVGGTTIHRLAVNVEGLPDAPRLVAIEAVGEKYFRLQDISVTTAAAPTASAASNWKGVSTYCLYLNGCSHYNLVRCQFFAGKASDGIAGKGSNNSTGFDGGNGGQGGRGGLGGIAFFGYNPGGVGGSGGSGGAAALLSGIDAAQAGGRGGNGGDGRDNSTTLPGFPGIDGGGLGGVGIGGRGGVTNTPAIGLLSCNKIGVDGTSAPIAGSNGINGNNGIATYDAGFFTPADGAPGTPGLAGAGGGGGSGAAQNNLLLKFGGGGGNGGSGGGGAGGGGFGGKGGGSSYALFLFNNGDDGNLIDCDLTTGVAGKGALGGNGGSGGKGAAANPIGPPCGSILQYNYGGMGGGGSNGGSGGNGGRGANGESLTIKRLGGKPLAQERLLKLSSQTLLLSGNGASYLGYTSSTDVDTRMIGKDAFTDLGPGSNPSSGINIMVTRYSQVGRKDILLKNDPANPLKKYTGFNNIIVNKPPTDSIRGRKIVCSGTYDYLSSLSEMSGMSFVWSVVNPAGGNSTIADPTASHAVITFTNNSTSDIIFTIKVDLTSNCCGVVGSETMQVLVRPDLKITKNPVNISICEGDSAIFSLAASGNNLQYEWRKNDTALQNGAIYQGVYTPVLKISAVDKSMQNALFSCKITHDCGTSQVGANLRVKPIPVASIVANPLNLCSGQTSRIDITSIPNGSLVTYSVNSESEVTVTAPYSFDAVINTATAFNKVSVSYDGCTNDTANDSFRVLVNNDTNLIFAGNDRQTCFDTITLAALPAVAPNTGKWSIISGTGGSFSEDTNPSALFRGVRGNTYVLSWMMFSPTCSDSRSDTVKIQMYSSSVLTKSSTSSITPICGRGTALLSVKSDKPSTYQWRSPALMHTPANETTLALESTASVPEIDASTYVYFKVTDENSCSIEDSLLILVYPKPIADIEGPDGLCSGEAATLKALGGISYEWFEGSVSTSQTIAINPTVTTVYKVAVTDANTCRDSAELKVRVETELLATISGKLEICLGDSTTLTAGGASDFEWIGGLTGTKKVQTVSPLVTTSYTVRARNGTCSDDTTVTVVVHTPPVISMRTDTLLCRGSSLNVEVSGGNTCIWNDGFTGFIRSLKPDSTTNYTVIVNDANQCSDTASMKITVLALPTANISGKSVICQGETTTLQGSGGIHYKWNTSGGAITESIDVSPSTTTTYRLTVTDSLACSKDTSFVLKVNPLPTPVITGVSEICVGDSANLRASGAIFYEWSTGETTDEIFVQPEVTTTYTLKGIDIRTCTASVQHTVKVNPLPTINLKENDTICLGATTWIECNGNADSYTWSNGYVGMRQEVKPDVSTTYTVTAAYTNGCKTQKSITIEVKSLPKIEISGTTSLCLDDTASLIATGAQSYLWSTGEIGGCIKIKANTISTYWVKGTGVNGCVASDTIHVDILPLPTPAITANNVICEGGSTTLFAKGGISYLWNTGESTANISVSPSTTTTYSVLVKASNGCTKSSSLQILVNPLPKITIITANPAICKGGSSTLVAQGAVSYLWNDSSTNYYKVVQPSETKQYTVIGTDVNGCKAIGDFQIEVYPLPNIQIEGVDALCENEETTLTATGGINYVWSNGKTTPSITEKPLTDTVYSVKVIDNNACENVDSIAITVRKVLTAYIEGNLEICEGESTIIKGYGGAYFQWTGGGVSETSRYLAITPTDTTTYTLSVSSPNLCTDDTTFTVNVKPFTPIRLSTIDTTICEENTIDFYALDALEYQWNTGSVIEKISVQPSVTTQYDLTVLDQNRCTQNFTFKANVNPKPQAVLNAPDALCIGTEISLNASGGHSYLWSTSAQTPSILMQPDKDTNVNVIVFSDKGCTDTAFKFIQVVNKIVATVTGDLVICNGESTTITAGGGSEYEWLEGASGNEKTLVLSPTETTTYRVKASTALCEDDTVFQIQVNDLPYASVNSDTNICFGESLRLTAEGGITYLWSTGETTQSISVHPTQSTDYMVSVTDTNNCKDNAYTTVNVDMLPNPKITGGNIICLYDTTILKGLNAYWYYWSTGETTQSIAVSPPATSTYTLTGVLANGCKNTTSTVVTVNPLPTVDVSGKDTVCAGTSTSLVAKGAVNFRWNNGSTSFMINPSPLLTTTYTVVGSDAKGCKDTVDYTVNVNPLPIIKILGIDGLCRGESTVLTASGAQTYLWNTGSTDDSIKVSPPVNTTYSVIGTDSNLCENSENMLVTVSKPMFATITGILTICEGDSTLLTAGGGSSYLWTQGTSGTDRAQWVKPNVSTDYTVVVSTQSGCTDSRTVRVTVNPLPSVQVSPDTTICEKESVLLSASGGTNYLWSTGETSASISVQPHTTTTYTVKVTDNNACTNSKHTNIQVNPKPLANIIAPPALCTGEDTIIYAQGGGSYLWNTGETTPVIRIKPLKDTTFWVIVKSNLSCSDTAYFSMEVRRPIRATISGKTDICFGDSTVLTASGGNEFLWTGGGISSTSNTIVLKPALTTEYRLETRTKTCYDDTVFKVNVYGLPSIDFSNDTAVCKGKGLDLFASGGNHYIWSTGDTTSRIHVVPTETSFYEVSVIDTNLCQSTAQIEVEVMPIPYPYITGTNIICKGDTVRLKANNGYSYTWNTLEIGSEIRVSPQVNTTYSVEAKLSNGCANTATIDISVNPTPILTIHGANQTCLGDSILLSVSGAIDYVWSTNAISSDIWVKPSVGTEYEVIGTDFNRCSSTAKYFVKVNPLPQIKIEGVDGLCTGETTTLRALGGISFLWNNGKTTQSITERPLVPTRFSVWVTDTNHCRDSAFVDVSVAAPIVASFRGKTEICEGDSTLLTGLGGAIFEWTDANNRVEAGKSVWFKPIKTTRYTLHASTPTGCYDDTTFTITVYPKPVLSISNDTSICEGENLILSVNGGNGNYIWSTGETTASIHVAPKISTNYTVQTEDIHACSSQANVYVEVNPKPSAFIDAPDALCTGEDTTIYALGTGNFLWNTGDISNSIYIKPLGDSTFWLVITSDKGCRSDTAKAFIEVGRPLTASFTGNTTICAGDTAILTAWGGAKYLWKNAEGFLQTGKTIHISPSRTTYYTLNASTSGCSDDTSFWLYVNPLPSIVFTPDTAICINDTARLSISGADAYLWSTGETSASISVAPKTTQIYSVHATENTHACSRSATIEVEVLARPNLYLFGDTLVCQYDSASLHARNAHTYWWSNGGMTPDIRVSPLKNTMYSVWARLQNDCDAEDSIEVKTLPSHRIHFYQTIFSDESYWFGNRELTEAGIYYDSMQNQAACDSIHILHLEVLASPYVKFIFKQTKHGVLQALHADTMLADTLRILIGDSIHLSTIPDKYYQLDALLANENEIPEGYFTAKTNTTFTPYFVITPPKGFIEGDTILCQGENFELGFTFSGIPPYTYKITDDIDYRKSSDSVFSIFLTAEESQVYTLLYLQDSLGTQALANDLKGSANIDVREIPEFRADDISISCENTLPYISLPYTLYSGQAKEYQLLFDTKALSLGFKNHTWSTLPLRDIQIDLPKTLPSDVYTAYLQMRNANACESHIDTIRIHAQYPNSIIRQKWDDVLLVQNEAYNGGYRFVACQWYKNGIALNEHKMYLYETPALDRTAEYRAKLEREDGVILFTCPVKLKPVVAEVQVYPNMVKKGGNVNVSVELGLETPNSPVRMRLSHIQGKVIEEKLLQLGQNNVNMPENTGYYLLEVIIDAENVKVFKIGVM